jgi:hypothetical protein
MSKAIGRSSLARVGLACSLLAACPQTVETNNAPSKTPCSSIGQRCEVSPGKLGSCVLVDGCTKDNCFICQSQH